MLNVRGNIIPPPPSYLAKYLVYESSSVRAAAIGI
jgi:hypothetical protein